MSRYLEESVSLLNKEGNSSKSDFIIEMDKFDAQHNLNTRTGSRISVTEDHRYISDSRTDFSSGTSISDDHEDISSKKPLEALSHDEETYYGMRPQPRPDEEVFDPINELNKKLLDAILEHDNVEVKSLLQKGASPNATCRARNITACHVAAYSNADALSLLLEHKAVKERTDMAGNTPLHLAAWAGSNRNIAMLLDFPNDLQNNLLSANDGMDSIPQISGEVINVACITKADVVMKDAWRCSKEHNCDKFMGTLVRFKPGWTPLHIVSFAGHDKSTRLLLAAGANPNVKDALGYTPLAIAGKACCLNTYTLDINSYVETIKALIECRKKLDNMDACPRELGSALHIAVQLNSEEAVKILLAAGAPVDQYDDRGNTPIHTCFAHYSETVLQLLVQHKQPGQSFRTIDVTDVEGYTVLHRAVLAASLQDVCAALNAGADVTHAVNDGYTAIHLAARKGNERILEKILDFTKGVNAVNYGNDRVETPLVCAIRSGDEWCVRKLINARASLELPTLPKYMRMPEDELSKMKTIFESMCTSPIITAMLGGLRMNNNTEWETMKNTKLNINTIFHAVWIHNTESEYIRIVNFLLFHEKSLGKLLFYRCPNFMNMTPIEIALFEKKYGIYEFLLRKTVQHAKELSIVFDPTLIWTHFYSTNNRFLNSSISIDMLKKTVQIFPDIVHIMPSNKCYILHEAIKNKDSGMMRLLLQNGADLSQCNDDGETAISTLMKLNTAAEFIKGLFDECFNFHSDIISGHFLTVKVDYRVLAPTMKETYEENQMRVLKAFLDTGNYRGQKKLLAHPLVESFLYTKWKAYSMYYCLSIFFYILFAMSLSVYIVSFSYYKDNGQPLPSLWNPVIWHFAICITLAIIFVQELLFVHLRFKNLMKFRPPLKMLVDCAVKYGSFGLGFVTPLVITFGDPDSELWRYLSILTLVLAWSNIMVLLSKTPSAGYYIQMFLDVTSKILKILLVFSSLIFMFSFCFMVQFHTQPPFNGPVAAIMKTLAMMSSEFDFESNFTGEKPNDFLVAIMIAHFTFVSFLILTAIVLMNLMTGVAVSDIQDLINKGNLRRIEKQIEFLYALEEARVNKSVFHVLGPHNWLTRKYVLKATELTPRIADYENEYNESIRDGLRSLRDTAQERLLKEVNEHNTVVHNSDLYKAFQVTHENKESIIKIESKLDDIIQLLRR